MADNVIGSFDGQNVFLENAATEATLKQLLAVMQVLAAKTGKGSDADKAAENLAKAMKSSGKESKNLTKTEKQKVDQLKKSKEVQQAYDESQERSKKKTEAVMDSMEGLTRATVAAANKLTSMVSSVANMGNSFSGAAGALGQVPLVGGLIGPVFSAIGAAGDKVYNSFIQASSVGASFNGSLQAMKEAASGAGLTIDQFTGLIAKNGDSLRFLGGTTAEGAKQLAALGKRLRTENRPLMNSLAGLGYSTEEISTGMARFGSMMVRSGKQLDQKALVETSGKYLQTLDAMAKLTGKSKDALQSEHDARMAESDFRLFTLKLDEKGVIASQMAMDLVPKQFQNAARELIATGIPKSDEAKALFKQLPALAQNLINVGQEARRSGTMTEKQVLAVDKAAQAEARRQIELSKAGKGTTEVLGQFGDTVDKNIAVGVAELAARGDAAKALADTAKTAKDAAKDAGGVLSPAQLMDAQQKMAIESNNFTMMLAARMPELQSAFTKLTEYINGPLMKAFNFMMDNFNTIVGVVGALSVAMLGIKTLFKGKELFDKFFGQRGSSPNKPLYVSMGGAGGLDDMLDGGGSDDKKGSKRRRNKKGQYRKATRLEKAGDFLKKVGPSAKTAGRLVKGSAVVGAAMSAYDAYDTFQDVDKQVAEGKMTKEEASKAKTVAGSKAVGTAAGGYGGAMAGAAIGTLIFPGVGTVIGGAIGGALGAWGGETAAGAAAEALTADQTTGDTALSADSKKKANDWAWSVLSGKATMSQVPIGLRDTVAEILKNPPGAWKKKLEGNITKPTAAIPKPPTSSTDLSIAQKDMTKTIDDKNKAMTAAAAQKLDPKTAAAAKDVMSTGTTNKPLTGQETPEQLLASLNTKLDQLIKVSKSNFDIAARQLTVQQGLSGNLHYSA
jgi:hypothetical protein